MALLPAVQFPVLKDVTVSRLSQANKPLGFKPLETPLHVQLQQQQKYIHSVPVAPFQPTVRRNDPYNWNWRVHPLSVAVAPVMIPIVSPNVPVIVDDSDEFETPEAPAGPCLCTALVQFKCHHGEFSSSFEIRKGQYVAVQGDRGHDVGVVIRINTEETKQYVERTGPAGSIIRHATQREVDYWATDLKADEAAALEYCKQRVIKHRLPMDVRHAEYQFDKKKLTFYYEAKARVDFVTLLKELFREFSCRIWMEKVRMHE